MYVLEKQAVRITEFEREMRSGSPDYHLIKQCFFCTKSP